MAHPGSEALLGVLDSPPPIPTGPFSVASALAAGVSVGRLRGKALARPFHGVRTLLPPTTLAGSCAALQVRMRDGDAFSHLTAARLWRMPLPLDLRDARLHVTSPAPVRALRGRGVVGHSEELAPNEVTSLRGLPVVTPARAWAQMSTVVSWFDAVALADFLVTGLPLEDLLPLSTMEEIEAAHLRAGSRGAARRRRALEHVSVGPFSRPESLSRVLFRLAGLPEAALNEGVADERGSFLAMPDQTWPEFRVAYEYEGKHHGQTAQFRRDITRLERLVDHGWLVVKGSADDLFDQPSELVARVARRLTSRGWTGRSRELPQYVRFGR